MFLDVIFETLGARGATSFIVLIISTISITAVARFLRYRLGFHNLHGSLISPPFNPFFGTIPAIAELYKNCPKDAHPQATMTLLSRKHDLGDIYFLDNWPAVPDRQMILTDPELGDQITRTHSLPKHPIYRYFAEHVCGKTSMIINNGDIWKRSRALFNPGFSAAHLMTMVPGIVDDVLIFKEKLGEVADKEELVQLEHITGHLTIDVMGHIVLDHDLNSQNGQNELVEAYRQQISWTPVSKVVNPIAGLNPIRPLANWYWARVMDNYIGKVLDDRYTLLSDGSSKTDHKCAIDLAVALYQKEAGATDQAPSRKLDPAFKQLIADQMKTFLFAGYDSTSSIICYIYHLLNLHPQHLAKVRQEHDEIFGKDPAAAADLIKNDPHILNKLPYSLAVIKETLRLFPAALTTRAGVPGISVTHNGISYPTDGFMIWVESHTIHRRADFFPNPDEFIPERFLSPTFPENAWRPFEKGPRNCIGQELTLLEMRIVMALTLRDLEIEARYEEWDRRLGRERPGDVLEGRRGMFGYRAYQVVKLSSKPSDDMPARVRRRKVDV